MRAKVLRRFGVQAFAVAVLVGSIAPVTPAVAQVAGLPGYVWGSVLVPDPPLASGPTTLELYGVYPTGCGRVVQTGVADSAHVTLWLRSTACVDTGSGRWFESFPLGIISAGIHTVHIQLIVDQPDSATANYTGALTFEVVGGGPPPPPPPPPPGPGPSSVLQFVATDPAEPIASRPMALTLGGRAPFGCPVPSSAAVLDSSHLALTLTANPDPCGADSASTWWTQRWELGLQREGHHAMTLVLTLAGGALPDTLRLPFDFLVYNDSVVPPPPPDSLANLLSTNRPNPFVQTTRFSVSTDTPENADVGVFDLQGRRVRHVFQGRLPVGTTQLAWNGFRDDGTRAVAGVYFYRLEMRGRVVSRRLILLPRH